MLTLIKTPTLIVSVGNKPKPIEESVGCINSISEALCIAKMVSAAGGEVPGQTTEFEEYTLVLSGMHRLETVDGIQYVFNGQTVIAPVGQWVRYSTPEEGGAEYVAICLPAFSPETVHRDS